MSSCFSATTTAKFGTSIRSIKNEFASLSNKMDSNRGDIAQLCDMMALLDKSSNRKGHRKGPKTLNKKTSAELVLEIIQSRGVLSAPKVFQYATARGWATKSTDPMASIRATISLLMRNGKLVSPEYGMYKIPAARRRVA